MSAEATPSWVLISVLFSTFPLDEGLALALHQVAFDLHASGDAVGAIDHGLAHGQVKNTRRAAAVGTITGPVFEAELETERGKARVHFILTRQGLELLQARAGAPAVPQYLN